jgi:hypothetical protein
MLHRGSAPAHLYRRGTQRPDGYARHRLEETILYQIIAEASRTLPRSRSFLAR